MRITAILPSVKYAKNRNKKPKPQTNVFFADVLHRRRKSQNREPSWFPAAKQYEISLQKNASHIVVSDFLAAAPSGASIRLRRILLGGIHFRR